MPMLDLGHVTQHGSEDSETVIFINYFITFWWSESPSGKNDVCN